MKSLRSELGTVTDAISGTILDTTKTTSLLSHIRQVLSGGLGSVGRDVRDKVKSILDDLNNQIANAGGDVDEVPACRDREAPRRARARPVDVEGAP